MQVYLTWIRYDDYESNLLGVGDSIRTAMGICQHDLNGLSDNRNARIRFGEEKSGVVIGDYDGRTYVIESHRVHIAEDVPEVD